MTKKISLTFKSTGKSLIITPCQFNLWLWCEIDTMCRT